MELPEPFNPSETIQPLGLPENCIDTDEAGIDVFAAGIGLQYENQPSNERDGLLRQATFKTFSRSKYNTRGSCYNMSTPSVILAGSETCGLGQGDSGER